MRVGVSVVVVTCDRPALLADALISVAAQTVPPLEVRLGDAGAVPVLDHLPELPLLELTARALPTLRPGAARNVMTAGARGEVLAFLDDDDRWRPDHLAGLAAAFADPAVGFAWRDSIVARERVHPDGRREVLATRTLARDWDDARMATDDYLPPSSWAVRRDLFEALGGFDEGFAYSEDWDFLLRMRPRTRVQRVPGVGAEIRLREAGNTSATMDAVRIDCLARLAARHGLPPLVPRTFWEVAEVVAAEARR
jgi:hypothetical protein